VDIQGEILGLPDQRCKIFQRHYRIRVRHGNQTSNIPGLDWFLLPIATLARAAISSDKSQRYDSLWYRLRLRVIL